MTTRTLKALLPLVAWIAVVTGLAAAQANSTPAAKPLLLEKNEGEVRVRRPRPVPVPGSEFILKVSPKNNGSQHLVAATEDIAPGTLIPAHKHQDQDEILLIHSGEAHVWLGDQERDLHAGGLIFIPANTWISMKNISSEPASITFIFSAPGFEEYLRCSSVPVGEKPTPMTQAEIEQCWHKGHAVLKPK